MPLQKLLTIEQRRRVIDSYRKPDSLPFASGDRERVNPDDDAGAIDERAATVSRIDGRVGLNQPDGANVANGADDASDSVFEDTPRAEPTAMTSSPTRAVDTEPS